MTTDCEVCGNQISSEKERAGRITCGDECFERLMDKCEQQLEELAKGA